MEALINSLKDPQWEGMEKVKEMNMQSFKINCIPPKGTAQQKSIRMIGNIPIVYDKKSAKNTKQLLFALLSQHTPLTPHKGALTVSVTWTYPWRKSESKKNMLNGFKPCTTRPDIDNLCKILFDSMTKLLFWHDDSQITTLLFSKRWGDNPGVTVIIDSEEQKCKPQLATV